MKRKFSLFVVIVTLVITFIAGHSRNIGASNSESYINDRHSAIEKIALENPEQGITALVVFDNYYNKDEVISILNLRDSSLQIRQISAGIRPELVKGTSLEHFQYTFDNYHGSVTNYTIDEFYEFGINKNNEIIDRLANLYKQQLQELKDQGEKLSDTEVKEWEEWLESISTTIVLQKELLPKELKIYNIGIFAPAKDVYNITNIPNVKLVDPYWSGENLPSIGHIRLE